MSHDQDLNMIDDYLLSGDCRAAEGIWNTLNFDEKQGAKTYSLATLEAKWIQIRQKSEQLVPLINKEIDDFLTSNNFDQKFADRLLHRLERALLTETSFMYSTVAHRVNRKIAQQKEAIIYAEAEKTVRFHWDEAIALQIKEPTTAPRILLSYYSTALQEAKRFLSEYERNDLYDESFKNRLRQLVEDADKRRESLNLAEKNLTSGPLSKEYLETLQHIQKNPSDIKVQIYDEVGVVIDTKPKDDAYKHYHDGALALARQKLTVYLDGGEGRLGIRKLLEEGRPREAEAIHAEYLDKFHQLETEFVPEITRTQERQDFFKAKANIDSHLYLFDAVEEEAQRISQDAVSASTRAELMSLWTDYQSNLRRYPLAENTCKAVKDAYQALRRRFSVYLFTVADKVNVAIQNGKFSEAEGLIKENNTVLALPIVAGEDVVNRIVVYNTELDAIANQLADISTRINDMFARMMTDTAVNLMTSLRELRQQYPETLLKSHEEYESVVAQVTSRDSAVADIERLRGYLVSSNMSNVKEGLNYALNKVNPPLPNLPNSLYLPIANELEAYLEFLKAGDLPLEERVVKLRQVAKSGMVSDEALKSRIATALEEAEKQTRLAEGNKQALERATNAFNAPNWLEVWNSLDLIQSVSDADEATKWNKLFVGSVNAYDLKTPFDKNLLTRLGDFQKKLPNTFPPDRYQILIAVQTARDHKTTGEMINAYETILTRVSGKDADTIKELLSEARTIQFVSESSNLLNQRPTGDPKEPEFQNWLNDLRQSVKEGMDLASEQPSQAVNYYVTCLKLDLLYIQNTTLPSNRTAGMIRVEEIVTKVKPLIEQNRSSLSTSADQKVIDVASEIRKIIGAMDDMKRYIAEDEDDIQHFKATLDTLNTFFGQEMRPREVLRDFMSQYEAHLKSVYETLRLNSQTATSNDLYSPKAFLRYVKMSLLKPDSKNDIKELVQLESLKDKSSEQLKITVDRFITHQITLSQMVNELDEQLKHMRVLGNITIELTGIKEFLALGAQIRDNIAFVEEIRKAIHSFDERVKKFTMLLEGYPLTYDTRTTYMTKLDGNFVDFKADVTRYFADFKNNAFDNRLVSVGESHPVIFALANDIIDLKHDFATITDQWTTILTFTSAQDFAQALTALEKFKALTRPFEIFMTKQICSDALPTTLTLRDRTINLPTINGYAELENWLICGQKTIEFVKNWRETQATVAIDEDDMKKRVARSEAHYLSAEFYNALEILDGIIGIEQQLDKYDKIPYWADKDGQPKFTIQFEYATAITNCPYTEAKDIIRKAQTEYNRLKSEIARIRGIREVIVIRMDEYNRLERVFNELFNKIKGARGNDKIIHRTNAQLILEQMAQIAPQSPAIANYKRTLNNL